MKKTYWVLSIGGTLDKNASGLPTIYYTSDPKVSPGGVPKLLENADAMFIPIEIEIPEAEALTRKHLDEKNRIIGALRDNAKPASREEKAEVQLCPGGVAYREADSSMTLASRIMEFLKSQGGAAQTSAAIAKELGASQDKVVLELCKLVTTYEYLRGERPLGCLSVVYWYDDAKSSVPPEKIVLDYLQQTRGGDSSAFWQSAAAISRETKLHLGDVQNILSRQCSTGAVARQSHIDGYLYRAVSKPFELTPTVARTSPTYVAVQKALKGNKYRFVSEIAVDAGCKLSIAEDILLELEKEGKAKSYDGLWKKPLLKKPCRIKAKSWREAVIQTLDTQKRPVTEAELELLVTKRYPDKCAGKSIHSAVGSAVHSLKHVQKHQRFKWEKKNGKVVMWTVPVKHA